MKTLRRRGGTLAFCYYINRTFERAMDFQYKDSISAELHNNRKGTESMAKKKVSVPQYGTVMRRGIQYYGIPTLPIFCMLALIQRQFSILRGMKTARQLWTSMRR